MLLQFMQWLETTTLSVSFHESIWSFPIVESVHVLGLCLFLGMAVLIAAQLAAGRARRAGNGEDGAAPPQKAPRTRYRASA